MVVTRENKQPVRYTRRWLLTRLLIVGGASLASPALPSRLALADVTQGDGEKPPLSQATGFMAHAFEMKRMAAEAGDQPYGAVIVKDNRIVGKGPSRVVTNQDPTAHAEMEAIRDAARHPFQTGGG